MKTINWLLLTITILLIGCSETPQPSSRDYTNTYNLISVTMNTYTSRLFVICDGRNDDAYIDNVQFKFDQSINQPIVEIIDAPHELTRMVITFKDRAQYKEYVHLSDGTHHEYISP